MLAHWLARRLIRRALRRSPDFVIGGADSPYLRRWWLWPRNRWCNAYLHQLLRDDDDRALHDHPWANLTLVLLGSYVEVMPLARTRWPLERRLMVRTRLAGEVVVRRATAPHRLMVPAGPCWTLFLTGPRVREWGFWCPHEWRHWRRFTNPADGGATIGRGCE